MGATTSGWIGGWLPAWKVSSNYCWFPPVNCSISEFWRSIYHDAVWLDINTCSYHAVCVTTYKLYWYCKSSNYYVTVYHRPNDWNLSWWHQCCSTVVLLDFFSMNTSILPVSMPLYQPANQHGDLSCQKFSQFISCSNNWLSVPQMAWCSLQDKQSFQDYFPSAQLCS